MKLINIALRYCKKVVCILLIVLALLAPGKSFADSQKVDIETRESLLKQAQIVNWNEMDRIMYMGSRFIVVDYKTGTFWIMERYMGGYHADVETINKESSDNKNSLKYDSENWKHRPVLVVMEDGRVYAASSFVLDHAGRDDKPFLKVVDDRSRGYGRGENYDKIKNNGMDGHICIHVRGSKNHFDGKESQKHQSNIDYLEKEKNK
jgi:hypothetical protein